jgi:hypothetical protein
MNTWYKVALVEKDGSWSEILHETIDEENHTIISIDEAKSLRLNYLTSYEHVKPEDVIIFKETREICDNGGICDIQLKNAEKKLQEYISKNEDGVTDFSWWKIDGDLWTTSYFSRKSNCIKQVSILFLKDSVVSCNIKDEQT